MIAAGLILTSCSASQKIGETDRTTVARMVGNKDFVFKASRVTAQNGFTKILTTDYDLEVSPDTIKAWLPYYGRAYTAPKDLTGRGIQFVSTQFRYESREGKKQGWEIKITPKEQEYDTGVNNLRLSITPSGYATLMVSSTRRQPISFYGKIEEKK